MADRPDPAREIRITGLHALRGLNYWSRRPVIRMDLAVGAYHDISSADAPDFTDRLVRALPGLADHWCSIGAPGGFVQRLRSGTYAPHIIEHVALELQIVLGLDVGFGRTRDGDAPGEYTLVFEHRHEPMGLRAGALALEIVQRAFAGTLEAVGASLTELQSLLTTPDMPPVTSAVFGGITGGTHRAEAQHELLRRLEYGNGAVVVDVSPAYLLRAGLPYARSEIAIVLDTRLTDVPERFRAADRARQLVSILADAVRPGGTFVCRAEDWELQDYARDRDCRIAIYSDDDVTPRDEHVALAVGRVRRGRMVLDGMTDRAEEARIAAGMPVAPQVAAALAAYVTLHDRSTSDRGSTTARSR